MLFIPNLNLYIVINVPVSMDQLSQLSFADEPMKGSEPPLTTDGWTSATAADECFGSVYVQTNRYKHRQ